MARSKWDNPDKEGRRLEKIIRLCETEITKNLQYDNHDMILAYIDRLIKATAQKEKLADIVLGINHLRKLAEKKYEQPKYIFPPQK